MVDAIKAAEILTAHLRNELLEDIPDDCKAQTPDEAIEVQLAILKHDQVTHNGCDQHNSFSTKLKNNAMATDQPIAALITDLKSRGMLDETLIIWATEFGRTPFEEAIRESKFGRGHHH